MTNKSIDINQRIPLDTLHAALESYLKNNYSTDYIVEQLQLDFEGDNRIKKAIRIINKIILKSPLLDIITNNKEEILSAVKRKTDRDIICVALLNAAFPFSFDVLKTFGKYFSVQDIINTETVKKPISNIYGGNRATENGMYSVIPMFIEANFFERPKSGLYQFNNKLKTSFSISKLLYLESYKINNKIDEIQDYQLLDPYFLFIE
jgi:hypothetical protein